MPKHEFTSNIKCANCEATVRKMLDQKEEILSFNVDLQKQDRPVQIESQEGVSKKEIIDWVSQSGFELKSKGSFFNKLFN